MKGPDDSPSKAKAKAFRSLSLFSHKSRFSLLQSAAGGKVAAAEYIDAADAAHYSQDMPQAVEMDIHCAISRASKTSPPACNKEPRDMQKQKQRCQQSSRQGGIVTTMERSGRTSSRKAVSESSKPAKAVSTSSNFLKSVIPVNSHNSRPVSSTVISCSQVLPVESSLHRITFPKCSVVEIEGHSGPLSNPPSPRDSALSALPRPLRSPRALTLELPKHGSPADDSVGHRTDRNNRASATRDSFCSSNGSGDRSSSRSTTAGDSSTSDSSSGSSSSCPVAPSFLVPSQFSPTAITENGDATKSKSLSNLMHRKWMSSESGSPTWSTATSQRRVFEDRTSSASSASIPMASPAASSTPATPSAANETAATAAGVLWHSAGSASSREAAAAAVVPPTVTAAGAPPAVNSSSHHNKSFGHHRFSFRRTETHPKLPSGGTERDGSPHTSRTVHYFPFHELEKGVSLPSPSLLKRHHLKTKKSLNSSSVASTLPFSPKLSGATARKAELRRSPSDITGVDRNAAPSSFLVLSCLAVIVLLALLFGRLPAIILTALWGLALSHAQSEPVTPRRMAASLEHRRGDMCSDISGGRLDSALVGGGIKGSEHYLNNAGKEGRRTSALSSTESRSPGLEKDVSAMTVDEILAYSSQRNDKRTHAILAGLLSRQRRASA
eukprot:TRINITY_DN14982_c0_g1_i1.p1 TRINITY_DN14982_c0_g1~~TRINITY_DN14982_c0_g1_i1.p1  ORF type:complete len:667 (-),score=79.30 TRINITY_DN14982_c0_g1_i1:695-2695(-)